MLVLMNWPLETSRDLLEEQGFHFRLIDAERIIDKEEENY